MDRIESMTVLVAVMEAGSLSAAGRKLGIPLPTVSRKLSELEMHLKARLLIRSTRRLTLTDAGRSYVAACRKILEDIHEAERTAEAAIDAAIAGVGITCVLSYQVEAALRAGQLALLLRRFEPPPTPVSFLYPGQGMLPVKMRALLDFAAPRLRAKLLHAEATLVQPAPASAKKRSVRKPR